MVEFTICQEWPAEVMRRSDDLSPVFANLLPGRRYRALRGWAKPTESMGEPGGAAGIVPGEGMRRASWAARVGSQTSRGFEQELGLRRFRFAGVPGRLGQASERVENRLVRHLLARSSAFRGHGAGGYNPYPRY